MPTSWRSRLVVLHTCVGSADGWRPAVVEPLSAVVIYTIVKILGGWATPWPAQEMLDNYGGWTMSKRCPRPCWNCSWCGGGGGGGLFPRVQGYIIGECSTIHSPPALFFFFFSQWILGLLMSCVWAHFLIGFHTMPKQRQSQSTPTPLGPGCMGV